MPFIYDLDNEYGGRIISDGDSTTPALDVKSGATWYPALRVGRTLIGNQSTAPFVFANLSAASVPVIDFGNNFVSTASIGTGPVGFTGTAEKWVIVRAGNINYGMPLFSLSTQINGPGAY